MQDAPTPPELLHAIATFLRNDILPQLEGGAAFQLRIAANAIDLVRREITLPGREAEDEHAGLQALLGVAGETEALTRELAQRIADGRIDLENPMLRALLWRVTEAKLAVDQPTYAGLQRARELRAAQEKN
jgi:hypothetical protein